MIISCPVCQTRFNADPARLGPGGRKVRCARCAHVWRIGADGMPAPEAQPDIPPVSAGEVEPAQAEALQVSPTGESVVGQADEELSMFAREMIEREEAVAAPESDESAAAPDRNEPPEAPVGVTGKRVLLADDGNKAGGETKGGDEKAALAKLAARKKQEPGKRKKGGKKFKGFVLLLCLAVILLFAANEIMKRYGPGRTSVPGPDVGAVEAPPKPTEGGGESGAAQ